MKDNISLPNHWAVTKLGGSLGAELKGPSIKNVTKKEVKVIKFNDETQRISLGIKQLTEDPWLKVFERFPIGSKMSGTCLL